MGKDKLEKQLTKEVHRFEDEDKIPEIHLDDLENIQKELSSDPEPNKAYAREMKEIQMALAAEVSIHSARRHSGHGKHEKPDSGQDSENTSRQTNNSNSEISSNPTENVNNHRIFGKIPVWVVILSASILIVLTSLIVIVTKSLLNTMWAPEEVETMLEEAVVTEAVTMTPEPTQLIVTPEPVVTEDPTPALAEEKVDEDEVFYVLLLGIDSVESKDSADAIMAAGVNVTKHTCHLIQFMRDLYVEIPGYGMDKISKAYRYGGGSLLAETITSNFNLPIRGYMSVDFDGFENIVNLMGGVSVKLTKGEADYLNRTNYIEKRKYRTMKPGIQNLNGQQMIGYLRISAVPDATNSSNDFGRVHRARDTMLQLMKRMRKLSFGDQLVVLDQSLSYVRTNLTKDEFKELLTIIADEGISSPATLRIPIKNAYKKSTKNGDLVIVLDMDKTVRQVHQLVYGENLKK